MVLGSLVGRRFDSCRIDGYAVLRYARTRRLNRMAKPPTKKVTILIPEALWLRARRQALDERTNLRALVLEGLELRLAKKGTKR